MWWGEQFLAVISNPNVVMLLLMFGVYGILFELYSPGWGVAGTLGVVSLLLAFFGLSVLPVNYVGLALIVVALAMFVAEVTVTSFGALTVGGIICLILGGMMLVDSPTGFLRVSLSVIVPVAVATGLITVLLLSRIVKAYRGPVQTGGEALLNREAVAQETFLPDNAGFHGQVFIHGELWRAHSATPVSSGQAVRIKGREGLTLEVEVNGQAEAATGEQT
jgi:membrane-bound serine protease (ClpP class)